MKKKNPEDIIISHLHTTNDDHMMYGSWDMESDRQNFFLLLDHFLPFYPPNNPENQNFEKMKKVPGDIIISQKCTINDNHMMYDSWDMKCERQNFLSFLAIFCPFTPLTTQKLKIFKKWKKQQEIPSFYTSVPKILIISYTVPEIWRLTDVIIFQFGSFFALLPP